MIINCQSATTTAQEYVTRDNCQTCKPIQTKSSIPDSKDEITLSTNIENQTKPNKKKRFSFTPAAIQATLTNLFSACFTKNKDPKVAGESLEKLKNFDDFDTFKDLQMCKGLTLEETKKVHKFLLSEGNKKIFLATLNGDKPMSLLSHVTTNPAEADTIKLLNKLNLGDNFDAVLANCFKYNNTHVKNSYFINKQQVLKVIDRNKDIYTSCLNLPKTESPQKIYDVLIQCAKNNNELPDDLLGITLGYPKYDSMIFNLENKAGLQPKRCASDYIEKMLEFFHSNQSPYQNLSPERYSALENAIKNINQQNLIDIAVKGSYHDGLYSFVNYNDDVSELSRIKAETNNYKKTFCLTE